MSKVTETLVQLWENQDSDLLSENLALHFKSHDRWFWRDVADEGLRIYSMMFAESAEKDSPLDSLLANVAASAAGGVFAAIAAALGVKSADLECAVSRWYDSQDLAPPAIGLQRLRHMLPQTGEPSWEHVVLGRLYHERVVQGFQEAAYPHAMDATKPCIDGLDPSDITEGDGGWTWQRPFTPSEETELTVGVDGAGEAITKAGYRVTGRGFTGTCQWLSFDAGATLSAPLDDYQTEFRNLLAAMDDEPLDTAAALPAASLDEEGATLGAAAALTEDVYAAAFGDPQPDPV